jgi:predicted ribosome quality control (RQC) complex YloA/Tae2 family protein
MSNLMWQEKLKGLKNALKRRLRTTRKYREKIAARLLECQCWKVKWHQAELLYAYLYLVHKGDRTIQVADWLQEDRQVTLSLNPKLKPHEEVAARFKEAKKLKIGLPYAERQLAQAEELYQKIIAERLAVEAISNEEELEKFLTTSPLPKPKSKGEPNKKAPSKPYWEYMTESNIPIWVGKNATMNDQLTFQYAHGNDYWLHVKDFSGSHVVIHTHAPLEEATLKLACQLALYHSRARERGEAEVSLTQVKYVKRYGREKGKVQIAQEKCFRTILDKPKLTTLRRQ